jgi:hypothetical protein
MSTDVLVPHEEQLLRQCRLTFWYHEEQLLRQCRLTFSIQFRLHTVNQINFTYSTAAYKIDGVSKQRKEKQLGMSVSAADRLTLTPGAGACSLTVNPSSGVCPFFFSAGNSKCARSCNFSAVFCSANEARPSCAVQRL